MPPRPRAESLFIVPERHLQQEAHLRQQAEDDLQRRAEACSPFPERQAVYRRLFAHICTPSVEIQKANSQPYTGKKVDSQGGVSLLFGSNN